MSADLAYAGLARQAQLVREGEVTARELVELCLERIERFDPQLNAFGAVYAEQALARGRGPAARAAERRADRGQGRDGHRGRDHQPRHRARSPSRAAQDAEVVRRLRDAGAIVIGKTKMPELGLWPFTESITWGVTRNPWDTDRTPGGSSGGSAAAVAAGLVPAAVGGRRRRLDPHSGGLLRAVRPQAAHAAGCRARRTTTTAGTGSASAALTRSVARRAS